jgi:hypothetical protein
MMSKDLTPTPSAASPKGDGVPAGEGQPATGVNFLAGTLESTRPTEYHLDIYIQEKTWDEKTPTCFSGR